ncbi:nuclear transport factor 2 family protein [Burkholderiaceae bacterium FT117]|uniref:YybH family protein n=1 Tax=Zeimonas sediminis TaxID=2944268 RepID=UPI002342C74F|nr:nuclear transport factor 2 family protein [Zeimonas sediminis]MCM5570656.1 nuclear transport factor 2 family protein [Zeimonas sediminis]
MRRTPLFDTAESVEEAFYDAMRRGDLPAMMSLWSSDDEVVCIHPGSARLTGLDAIRASWESIFSGGGVAVRTRDAVVQSSGVVSVHNLVEQVTITGRMGSQVVECVVTNVYAKTAAGWRIVLHHGSPAAEVEPSAPAGAVLH